jgi:anaerobic magnesium-protoporphyrin IX monomethyl ester cyclase
MESQRQVIQPDLSRWDYKHQVLATRWLPPWRILLWSKLIEAIMQLRPKAILRVLAHPDPEVRWAMRWYYQIGRKVWPYEIWHFLFLDRRTKTGPTLTRFLGQPQDTDAPILRPQRKTANASFVVVTAEHD